MLTDPVTLRSLTTSLHHNFCAQVYSEALFIKVGYHILHMVNLVVVLGVIGNILSVVGVVICNKYITERDGYNFMVFLSALHFTATYIVNTISTITFL